MRICSVKECIKKHYGWGYCQKHWKHYKTYGTLNLTIQHHGMRHTPEYETWKDMKKRCYNLNWKQYADYGGRGISVCDRWINNFLAFYIDMGAKPEKTSLDRIDNSRNYSPDNCRWATRLQQANNKRNNIVLSINGETHTLPEWCRLKELKYNTIKRRLYKGWSPQKALSL